MLFRGAGLDFTKTLTTPTNSKKYTFSTWVKRSAFGGTGQVLFVGGAGTSYAFTFDGSGVVGSNPDSLLLVSSNSGGTVRVQSKQYFLDPTQWQHVLLAVDTTQATAADRVKIYVNGNELSYIYMTYPALNADTGINTASAHRIGSWGPGSINFLGYMADTYLIDGQALAPSSFGQENARGAWVPKAYSGTYGTNGIFLNFTNSGAYGVDSSGNGNTWTANGFTAGVDQTIDTPTRNFPTYSIADKYFDFNVSTGALYAWPTTGNTQLRSTIGVTSGKWYWEVLHGGSAVSNYGVGTFFMNMGNWGGADAYGWGYHSSNGQISNNGSVVAFGSTWGPGNTMGVALDADSGKVWFAKDNVWQMSGNPAAGTNPSYSNLTGGPFYATFGGNPGGGGQINFGQGGLIGLTYNAAAGGSFKYAPPAGFLAINTQNISNNDFVPDLVWIKSRSAATDHALYDPVRGATLDLGSNLVAGETQQTAGLLGFNAGGFSVGTLAKLNSNAASYVAWMWKEGVTPGFEVVTYVGNNTVRTVPHGLGAVPAFMIVRMRNDGTPRNWNVYHQSAGPTGSYYLNNSTAFTAATLWNNTAPTSSVFTLGNSGPGAPEVNAAGVNYVAYLWAEVPGFSKFGVYTGNGSADGPFIYTGFKPAYLLIKRSDSASDWTVVDAARNPFNVMKNRLFAYHVATEDATADVGDAVSNGFKIRSNSAVWNASGGSYIYAAFAEAPFKYANGR